MSRPAHEISRKRPARYTGLAMATNESGGLERLVTELSMRFTGVHVDRIDGEIERGLRLLVEFLGVDRSTLSEFSVDGTSFRHVAAWARSESAPYLTEDVQTELPWYHAHVVRGETLRLERLLDDLPGEAVHEREMAQRTGLKSNLTIPIMVGGRHVLVLATGAIREFRAWPDEVVERVRLVGQILASGLHRKRVESELRAAVTALEGTQKELETHLAEIRQLTDRLESENVYLRAEIRRESGFDAIVGQSPAILNVLAQIAQVAPTDSSVLLLGETGTGKELLARAIHDRSPRRSAPLVTVNCAALPPSLIESELFGHERGAFTGATGAKAGRFELADGGTLFLDEIGELSADLQVKLLRFLQHGEFERVGSALTRRVDVRVVAATNRDLAQAMADTTFRKDLYFRLGVFPIRVPPLRNRREDIPLLVWAYITRRQVKLRRRIERVPKRAMEALMTYGWPGNVRELENVIDRALILSTGSALHFEEMLNAPAHGAAGQPALERLDDVQRAHIRSVLESCSWKIDGKGHAADKLGLNPSTLRSWMERLGITRPPRRE
jgi:formate hydrogenlyase transcriptional activator